MPSASSLFPGLLVAALAELSGFAGHVFAQGVPIIDGSRLSNLISRLAEQAEDAVKQGEKLDTHKSLNEIEAEQLAAYQAFLADTTGWTDVSSFEAGGVDFPSADETYPVTETSPEAQRLFGDGATVEAMIIATAHRYDGHPGIAAAGLNPTTWRILFQSLVKQESGFNNAAVSPVGALGFTQLMPGTAAGLGVDPSDPEQNLDGGARYLATQLQSFGRVDLALAAYNAGPGNVRKSGGIPPFEETQNYVRRIAGFYDSYLSVITGADVMAAFTIHIADDLTPPDLTKVENIGDTLSFVVAMMLGTGLMAMVPTIAQSLAQTATGLGGVASSTFRTGGSMASYGRSGAAGMIGAVRGAANMDAGGRRPSNARLTGHAAGQIGRSAVQVAMRLASRTPDKS